MTDQDMEIDLRPYILLLFRNWYIILIAMALAAGIAYFVTASLPPYYEATALIAVTEPNYSMEFDTRIQTLDGDKPVYKAYPEVAKGGELVSLVYAALDPVPEDIDSPFKLGRCMTAENGADPSLMHLTVTMPSPEEAARIANTWAAIFIQKAHSIYGSQSGNEVRFFEDQLALNLVEVEQAEQALITFESTNELVTLQNELNTLTDTHLKYLRQQQDIDFVIRDLEGLRQNLQTQDRSAPAAFADQLSLLSLQTSAYDAGTRLPVDLQLVDTTTLSNQTVGDQLRVLDDLVTTLQDKSVTNSNNLEILGPRILALQQQISTLLTEKTRLNRTLSLKRDMDIALSRKFEEVSITSEETPSEFRNAGQAIAPEKPSGPSKMINTAVAGLTAAMLCVGILLFIQFWQAGAIAENIEVRKAGSLEVFGGNGDGIVEDSRTQEGVSDPQKVFRQT